MQLSLLDMKINVKEDQEKTRQLKREKEAKEKEEK